ncbi:unnamed protein product, partial [Rotaria sp. Silwood1]
MPKSYFESNSLSTLEIFKQCFGDIRIEENGFVVSHGTSMSSGEVRGGNEYTSSRYRLRFKIEKPSTWIFIGIISKTTPVQKDSYRSLSSYGWIAHHHDYTGGV